MIWLLGRSGMLGQDIALSLERAGLPFIATDSQVDITDFDALKSFSQGKGIKWIVNAAAYTAVDKAESEEEIALAVNGRGPGNIGQVAAELRVPVVHFSTDYVFDGTKIGPYREDDPVHPVSAYGRTKLAGEQALQQATPLHYIFRVSWLYGHHGGNFVLTMLRLFNERDRVGVVDDQRGAPTWTRPLAENLVQLFRTEQAHLPEPGVYLYSDEGDISWFDFAYAIREEAGALGLLKQEVQLDAIGTVDYPTPARRPANSAFDKARVIEKMGFTVPAWRENLNQFLRERIEE